MFLNLSPNNLKAQRVLHQEHAESFLATSPTGPWQSSHWSPMHGEGQDTGQTLHVGIATLTSRKTRKKGITTYTRKQRTLSKPCSSCSKLCMPVINCDCFEGRRLVFCPRKYVGFNTMYWNKKRLTRGFAFCQSSVSLPKAMWKHWYACGISDLNLSKLTSMLPSLTDS